MVGRVVSHFVWRFARLSQARIIPPENSQEALETTLKTTAEALKEELARLQAELAASQQDLSLTRSAS